ncbi:hypothetical protein D1F64_02350 [Breoghania sp. L-A4]|nr:hypothetical protein D1F64_02350 [Breoghania sp. L-A4]
MSAGAAPAETLTWTITSQHPNTIELEFYSQSRKHVWPGKGKVYVIDDYDEHTYTLKCDAGEDICYGAWVKNESSTYWGSGKGDKEGCEECCYTCDGGQSEAIELVK